MSEQIIDNVKITTDDNGNQHFESIEDETPIETVDNRSWFKKIWDWWTNAPIVPYVKQRDLSNPFDDEDKEGGKKAIEIGVKVRF